MLVYFSMVELLYIFIACKGYCQFAYAFVSRKLGVGNFLVTDVDWSCKALLYKEEALLVIPTTLPLLFVSDVQYRSQQVVDSCSTRLTAF